MMIELSREVEDKLRLLAENQGRQLSSVVEEAIRQYLESTAITDLEEGAVAETQLKLVKELPVESA